MLRVCLLSFQREKIVNGKVEPTDEECDWPSDDEDEEEEVSQDLELCFGEKLVTLVSKFCPLSLVSFKI